MAMNSSRSMNAELGEGATDGKYKKIVNNRGGTVEDLTYRTRMDLHDTWYGIHEEAVKFPGGFTSPVHTPDYHVNTTAR